MPANSPFFPLSHTILELPRYFSYLAQENIENNAYFNRARLES